jgi:hypothetical protein
MIQERQNILNVKIQAEQLNFLMQTIHAHHNDFDCHQLNALWGWLMISLVLFTTGRIKKSKLSLRMMRQKEKAGSMDNLINTYRRRILKAALLRHQRKTGSNCLVIKLNKGGINTVELTEILLDGLLRKFERLAISEYGNVEGVKAIKGIYSSAVDVNGSGEFLTDSGKELIDELISELVEFVKKQKVEAPKTEGHEMEADGTDSDTNS